MKETVSNEVWTTLSKAEQYRKLMRILMGKRWYRVALRGYKILLNRRK